MRLLEGFNVILLEDCNSHNYLVRINPNKPIGRLGQQPTNSGTSIRAGRYECSRVGAVRYGRISERVMIVSDATFFTRTMQLITICQDLIDRCPPDAPDVATALGSALTFSTRNAELVRDSAF